MQRELRRFAVAGVIGFVVDAGVLYGTLAIGLGYYAGRIISFLSAASITWLINRNFTFVASSELSLWREWAKYIAAMSGGGSINFAIYSVTIFSLPDIHFLPLIAVALGTLTGMAINFSAAKWWVFKKA